MKNKPSIMVQLIHIEGPLKGEIQESYDSEIYIGRHPSCLVCFPKDQTLISRKHARIIREGNRFKLIDQSTNGTYVNGKKISEIYLRDGDVLAFAETGPKISFLSKFAEDGQVVEHAGPSTKGPGVARSVDHRVPILEQQDGPDLEEVDTIQRIQAPLFIQLGPILQSYKELPVTIGKNPICDFILNHPGIFDKHAQIYFSQNHYWVKDLTGQQNVSINGEVIPFQAPLDHENCLTLSPQGPKFRFYKGGRLAEIEE
jgi:pSer/pThr/pTyr-binding forkhead associated (FHA) protein